MISNPTENNTPNDAYNSRIFKKRDNVLSGNFNVIPFPYRRASYFFPGVARASYTLVTAETKFGKTQFATNAFILEPLWNAYRNPKLKLRYLYLNLEESEERIKDRIVSFLLYKYTNGRLRVSYLDLNSSMIPLSEDVCNILEDPQFIKLRNFYFSHIEFEDTTYPTGIDIAVKKFARKNGTIVYGDSFDTIDNMTGKKTTRNVIKGFTQNDPDEFLVVFADNMNNVTPERGQTLLQAITTVSKSFKDDRNKLGLTIIALQQQNSDVDSNDSFSNKRVEPKVTTLADCKQVSRDINMAIGIFSPTMKYKDLPPADPRTKVYRKYNIAKFGKYFRSVLFLVNRDGESDKVFPFYFDGITCIWEELPLWDDTRGLQVYYDRIAHIKAEEERDKANKDSIRQRMLNNVSFFIHKFKKVFTININKHGKFLHDFR